MNTHAQNTKLKTPAITLAAFAIAALVIFFPSASSAETCRWRTVAAMDWLGVSDEAVPASNPSNWAVDEGGVCALNSGSTLIFERSVWSPQNVDWDIAREVGTVELSPSFSGRRVNVRSNTMRVRNNFTVRGGVVNFRSPSIRIRGGFFVNGGNIMIGSYSSASPIAMTVGNFRQTTGTIDLVNSRFSVDQSFERIGGNFNAGISTVYLGSSALPCAAGTRCSALPTTAEPFRVMGTTTFNNVIVQGDYSVIGEIAANGRITIDNGARLSVRGSADTCLPSWDACSYFFPSYTNNLTLYGTGEPLVNRGNFLANEFSNVAYHGTGATAILPAAYNNLALGSGEYTLSQNTSANGAFLLDGGRLNLNGRTLSVPETFSNRGTITPSEGRIIYPISLIALDSDASSERGVTLFMTWSDMAYAVVRAPGANLNAAAPDAISVTLATDQGDEEPVRLAETGPDTGLFRSAAIAFSTASSPTRRNNRLEVSGSGSLTLRHGTGADARYFTALFTGRSADIPPTPAPSTTPSCSAPSILASGSAMRVNEGAAETTDRLARLAFAMDGAREMMIANSANFTGAGWEPYTPNKLWTLLDGAGVRPVYVLFRSACGGLSPPFSASIILTAASAPSSPPAVPSSTVATSTVSTISLTPGPCAPPVSGAFAVVINDGFGTTRSKIARLSFSASNAEHMMVSNEAGFADTFWKPFRASLEWPLSPGAGAKTVYVKFVSSCGMEAGPFSASIDLLEDAAPPIDAGAGRITATAAGLKSDSLVAFKSAPKAEYEIRQTIKIPFEIKSQWTTSKNIKVVRQLIDNESGKVLFTNTYSALLRPGKTIKRNIVQPILPRYDDGSYTIKVQILDLAKGAKQRQLDWNAFEFAVR